MKATIERSGGFAGIRIKREVEISSVQLDELRREGRKRAQTAPDEVLYKVTVGRSAFTVAHSPLIEQLLAR